MWYAQRIALSPHAIYVLRIVQLSESGAHGPRRGVVGGRGANNRAPLMAAAVVAGRDSSAGAKGPGGAAFGEMGGLEREMAQMFTGCPL